MAAFLFPLIIYHLVYHLIGVVFIMTAMLILGAPGVGLCGFFIAGGRMQLSNRIITAISAAAISISGVMIYELEGTEYTPYYDVAGVLTVCQGHTGDDIDPSKTYTEEECEQFLHDDLNRIANEINPHIKTEISVTQRAALYSFAYNVGSGAFNRSTLLKKLNAGDKVGACDELKRWVYADGQKWQGLVNRRDVEEAVCEYAI